jgi:MFS family permease
MRSLLNSINSVAAIGLVFSSARMLIGATSAVYLLSKGMSAGDIGIMKSFQALLLMILDFPLGVLADHKGRRICLVLGGLAGSTWLALTAASSSFWILLLAEGLNALSLASFNGAFDALLAEKYIKERGRPFLNRLLGDYHAILFGMMALFSLAGGTFVSPESSVFWWIASGILLAITALIPLLVRDDSNFHRSQNAAAAGTEKPNLLKLIKGEFVQVLRQIWSVPEVRRIALPFVGIGVFYQLLIPYWQFFFMNSNQGEFMLGGFKLSFFGPLFFGILVIQSIASKTMSIGYIASASQRKLLVHVFIAILFLTVTSLFEAGLWLSIITVLGVFGLLRLFTLSGSSRLHNLIEDSRRASVLSALSVLTRVVLVVVLPLSGFLIQAIGVWCLPLFGIVLSICFLAAELLGEQHIFQLKSDQNQVEMA